MFYPSGKIILKIVKYVWFYFFLILFNGRSVTFIKIVV